ncbi:nucleolar MIF4G domain-containing protein 1 homolog [Chironomus tepperi]|uniref:nucleolar MIF4G domain-containing protein 1 homolog n=1 Tax=Chironomus tepperi TaxID=113505 RepID=UPI00391F1E2A
MKPKLNKYRKQKPKQKTRKELRKEKRQQKKLNRFSYHNTKKGKTGNGKNEHPSKKKNKDEYDSEEEFMNSDNENFDEMDEEIPSSEDEVEQPAKSKNDPNQNQMQKFLDRQKKEHDEYFSEIKSSRIDQLKQANEDEDKIIGKYEKLLKLNKKKRKDGGISKFNDGLDYLLELCTDDSIQKMYKAAKEAADFEDPDESLPKKPPKKKRKKDVQESDDEPDPEETKELTRKAEKLKKFEEKYFGDDEDFFKNNPEIDSCDGSDSELEGDDDIEDQDSDDAGSGSDEEDADDLGSDEEDADDLGSDEEDGADFGSDGEDAADFGNDGDDAADSGSEIGGNDDFGSENEQSGSDESEEEVKEDIYGRKIDKKGNLIQEDKSKYVPPHLRKSLKSVDAESDPKRREKLQNLKRQINGFINRLAEANLHRISIDIENMYSSNARNDMNTVLTEVIQNSLVSNVLARDRAVLENTLLIAVLHANIGSEIGAFFLQILVERFDKLFKNIDATDVGNKELDNVIFVICHLYTYKLFKHNIIYEILEKLCSKLTEKRIECILLVLKSIGFILRKDDPVALKEFILKAQKMLNSKEVESNTRITYMLDVLMAIKNNNVTKIPQYDASIVDHFRKLLKQFVRPGKYVTTLALTLDDLLNAEERGKWWLVGSAWAGNDPQDRNKKSDFQEETTNDEQRNKIMALAKKQRMNTDAKRNVFYVLMTAEDYVDAFEKILSSTNDERTIISVILHCCLSEKEYNEYYSVLAQKFCEHNRKYLLAIQFAVWDKIKELDNLNPKQINNLSRFLIFLIENDNLPLSVLKVVEFAQIEKSSLRLVRQVMLGLLLAKEENFERIFERISPSMKLNAFKDQLRLFLKVFLLKDNTLKINEEQMQKLESRIEMAEKFLSLSHM